MACLEPPLIYQEDLSHHLTERGLETALKSEGQIDLEETNVVPGVP